MSDLISRNDAVEAIEFEKVYMTAYKGSSNGYISEGNPLKQYNKGLDDAIKAVNNLAPAEPERTAKVVCHGTTMGLSFCCGNCGKPVHSEGKYCHHCGAKLDWSGHE